MNILAAKSFAASLSSNHWRGLTRQDLSRIASYIDSDGCTMVLDIYLRCCVIHDWYYDTHLNFDGTPIARRQADEIFRLCMQRKSVFGRFSPMSWWRWTAVRLFGGKGWDKNLYEGV